MNEAAVLALFQTINALVPVIGNAIRALASIGRISPDEVNAMEAMLANQQTLAQTIQQRARDAISGT